jgi:hypothetical protein
MKFLNKNYEVHLENILRLRYGNINTTKDQ